MKLFLSNEQVTCSCFPHHTFLILYFAYSISSGGKAIEISGEHLDASLLHYDSCKGLESEEEERDDSMQRPGCESRIKFVALDDADKVWWEKERGIDRQADKRTDKQELLDWQTGKNDEWLRAAEGRPENKSNKIKKHLRWEIVMQKISCSR